MPLFVYGTLRDPDVLAAVLGHPHLLHQAAEANGYAALHYPGRSYPALVASPGQLGPYCSSPALRLQTSIGSMPSRARNIGAP